MPRFANFLIMRLMQKAPTLLRGNWDFPPSKVGVSSEESATLHGSFSGLEAMLFWFVIENTNCHTAEANALSLKKA